MSINPLSPVNTQYINTYKTTKTKQDNNSAKNKRFLINATASICVCALTIAGIALCKKKLSLQNTKTTEPIKDAVDELSKKLNEMQQLKIRKPATTCEGVISYERNVPFVSTSIEDDVANWQKFRSKAPKCNRNNIPINTDFKEFKILPHKYMDDTDILIHGRDYTCDFSSYKVEDGKISWLDGIIHKMIREKDSSYQFEIQPDKRCLQTGVFEDGRKYVSCTYFLGETVENNRQNYETIMLVSKGKNFTQSQKDLIKSFECSKNHRFENDVPPMIFGKYTPANATESPINQAVFLENKNALLSSISSWANNVGEFDIESFLKIQGDTFRIGK